ncbi:hypothetical protein CEF21_01010 [Bacillus sp. FJAT-42376]|uniref:SA1320 family protein n=1 Tax=Bacillus sp. FJAT-42376 TaxID=2014076 RepID=UPI000F4D6C66|nr:hypothetical protein [Bacillus sp. FJAT-42376]AZB41030.1 hypothetical protein CEF21_01010 [Bacillus sp. FJAT-42376]
MSANTTENKNTDRDLVELSGKTAYQYPSVYRELNINSNRYKVVDTNYSSPSGFDAMTVQNKETGEYSIIYVGTEPNQDNNKADIYTDAKLLSELEIDQMTEANEYYEEMNKKYGIDSVAGNSLGGGLALSVGVNHPDLKTVTYNPALLPKGMVDPTKDYSNMTSYFGKYDPLTLAEVALDLGHRIPGNHYTINNGLPDFGEDFSTFISNHTGYGKSEYGVAEIGADEFIITSIWTEEPLYGGGNSTKIELNKGALETLASSLESEIKGRASRISGYIDKAEDIVKTEADAFNKRVDTLRDILIDMVKAAVGDPAIHSLTKDGEAAKFLLNSTDALITTAEDLCRGLNSILNSPPAQLIEFCTSTNISVESLFRSLRKEVNKSFESVFDTASLFSKILDTVIPILIRGGTDFTDDAVVNEYNSHYTILQKNAHTMITQIDNYKSQVTGFVEAIFDADQDIGTKIENGSGTLNEIAQVSRTIPSNMNDSPYFTFATDLKDIVSESNYELFKTTCTGSLLPILCAFESALVLGETILESISFAVKSAAVTVVSLTPDLFGLFEQFDRQIKNFVQKITAVLDEAASFVEGLREGIGKLIMNLPDLVEAFQPYLETAIFEETKYKELHIYNQVSLSALEDMDKLFGDIIYQLSDHKSEAVQVLCETSEKLSKNFSTLREQIECCTVN